MFSQSHFSVMKWNKIKSKASFGKRKSSSFKCNKNQVKSLHNEEATSLLQTLAKTNTYGMICTFVGPTSFRDSYAQVLLLDGASRMDCATRDP